jgi:cytochrome c553
MRMFLGLTQKELADTGSNRRTRLPARASLGAFLGLFLVASLGVSVAAHAAGNAVEGEKKFYTCVGCHGIDNYKNAYPDYSVPRLRHQTAAYIVAALQEYKDGQRPHATMHAQASSLSTQDMEDIAAYLQGPEPVKPPMTPATGAPAQVTACAACHGDRGLGIAADMEPKPPILAGQHEDYLVQALTSYRNGRRKNAVMSGMAQSLASEHDVEVAAQYFSSQPSPLATATTSSK